MRVVVESPIVAFKVLFSFSLSFHVPLAAQSVMDLLHEATEPQLTYFITNRVPTVIYMFYNFNKENNSSCS
jgi:hypothetical protein